MTISRRTLTLGAFGVTASACASPRRERELVLSVNLATVEPPADAARLETAFDQARRMTVPVFVDRRGPFAFVVDTGANRTVVGLETAARCGLPSDGEAAVHGIAGAQTAPLVRASRLRVGEVQSRDLSLPALPRDSLGADGLLGIDVLKNRRIRLDFRRNTFEVAFSGSGPAIRPGHDTRIPERPYGVVVPAQHRSGQLVILDADVAGVPVRAFLDTGSQVTCGNEALRRALIAQRGDAGGSLSRTTLISATGQTTDALFATLPRLRLGGIGLYAVRAAFADLHIFNLWGLNDRPAMLVGIDVLRHFDELSLDFGRREVTFVRGRLMK